MASIKKHIKTDGRVGYLIKWYDHSGTQRSKTVYLPKSKAKIVADRLEREAREIKYGIRPNPNLNPTLKALTFKFLVASEIDGKSPQTIERYKKVFKPFLKWFGDDCKLQTIDIEMIEEYKAERTRKKVKPVSLNTELRHLKALFSWVVAREYLPKSPFKEVKMLQVKEQKIRFLSEEEVKSLYEAIKKKKDQRAWDLVTFYLQTGARASEILEVGGFTWDSVKEDHIEIIGKGSKRRAVPLNPTLREILERRRTLRSPFPYTYSAVSQTLSRRLFHRANIPDANLHTLRKTAGALLIQAGVDIYRVSKFLGHSSVKVTEKHYVDLLKSDYQDMSDILGECTPSSSIVSESLAEIQYEAA